MDVRNAQHTVTIEALAALGAEQLAYIKPEVIDGQTLYLIYDALGERIGGYQDKDVAFAACRQQELEPLSVH
jgi:hypothetical protein